MRRLSMCVVACGLLAVVGVSVRAIGQETPGGPPRKSEGGRGGPEGGGPPPGFHLLPRFLVDKLNLSEDQRKQIEELEQETKAKLNKILTPEQQKIMAETRPPRPGSGRSGQGSSRRGSTDRPDGNRGGDPPPKPQRPPE